MLKGTKRLKRRKSAGANCHESLTSQRVLRYCGLRSLDKHRRAVFGVYPAAVNWGVFYAILRFWRATGQSNPI